MEDSLKPLPGRGIELGRRRKLVTSRQCRGGFVDAGLAGER